MYVPELVRKVGLRRGLSIRTIKTYRQCIKQFFRSCRKDPKEVKKVDIKDYLDKLIELGCSGNTLNVHLNSLKFLYNEILNKRLLLNIRFSKTPKTMPTVLTKQEVIGLFGVVGNSKHKLMIQLMYSAGLRVSELVNLKVGDLELDEGYGWVRKGKGNKDRPFIIARNLRRQLMDYISRETLNGYLFRGKNGPISIMSVHRIIKEAAKKSGIKKNVHAHTLRHSFATHLIEDGYDVASVQSLLGHGSVETTMVYVHMASPRMINVRSPFDNLQI